MRSPSASPWKWKSEPERTGWRRINGRKDVWPKLKQAIFVRTVVQKAPNGLENARLAANGIPMLRKLFKRTRRDVANGNRARTVPDARISPESWGKSMKNSFRE